MSWFSSLFGGKNEEPQQQVPAAPVYKTAQQLFDEAMGFAKTNTPYAYGAREGALGDLASKNAYYESFQPTSFEDALANKNFELAKRGINQGLSLSGMEYSPILSQQYGDAGAKIGEYLSNLGNQRALYSLQSRLGIDPYSTYQPFLASNQGQSNLQTGANYENALLKSQADYQNALQAYNQQGAGISSLSSLAGAGIGFAFGGPTGAMLGASLGGTASPLWGGSQSPISMSDALAYAKPQVSPVTVNYPQPSAPAYQPSTYIPQNFDFKSTFNPASSWQDQFQMY